jgi:hypothetical protein
MFAWEMSLLMSEEQAGCAAIDGGCDEGCGEWTGTGRTGAVASGNLTSGVAKAVEVVTSSTK